MSFKTPQEVGFNFAQVYNEMILSAINQYSLPAEMFGVEKPFDHGETLNVPTTGTVGLYQGAEDSLPQYERLDTGRITLTINQYPETAWFYTNEFDEDMSLVSQLLAEHQNQARIAMREFVETTAFSTINSCHTAGNANLVNGKASRITATGSGNTVGLDDFVAMKLFHDKLGVPTGSRVAIVPPEVAGTIGKLVNDQAFVATPFIEGLLETGVSDTMEFIGRYHGYNILVSNRLPELGSETIGAVTVANAQPCLFLDLSQESHKPFMYAWRRPPKVEYEYKMDSGRHCYKMTGRFGTAPHRRTTVGIIVANTNNY